MVGVTRLLCGTATPGDALRYGRNTAHLPAHLLHYSEDKRPIVVWNCTRRCNLRCVHCYSDSRNAEYQGELTTAEGKALIDSLAEFRVPTLLFSGGEPLTRPDIFELASYARQKGLRCVLSTNGTLIDETAAARIKEAGFSYVGVSIDGLEATHDRIRGERGAFARTLQGIRYCRDSGTRVGLRFTVHKLNVDQLSGIFQLMREERIPRCCIYHLAYAGRGDRLKRNDLTPEETREVVDFIFDQAQQLHADGADLDLLTVDNHTDGVYLYMRVQRDQPERADEVYRMLRWNGGNQSGIAIACIDNQGFVHPDQFSWHQNLGNVRERSFADIWTDTTNPLMAFLKNRKPHLTGRCASCKYLEICNGNLRVRAERYHGDIHAPDPACYLTDEEIAVA